ncbi:BIR protein [Theileria orientalis strain Shintoku]|uniref:BIR protein n=1 Tax=Theileria orientalis strain Shintoku TaxID=869250 RepID=J4DPL6_THEOR|nr:BIR protein [Theileria orientalis strain Shintoku]BAM40919.1 BIR protein [Theileria orientalis strain Shintoku]|eukprot:XP_009691220.1 BIR protein [Theileria orientalis strain Shintoku]
MPLPSTSNIAKMWVPVIPVSGWPVIQFISLFFVQPNIWVECWMNSNSIYHIFLIFAPWCAWAF